MSPRYEGKPSNPQTTAGLTAITPFGYAGGYTDPTGLIYLVHRYYDPITGQFVSLDPAVDKTQLPYAYAAGNPVSESDPTGLWATGGCAHAVPSCRYWRALYATYNEMHLIIGSNAFASIRYMNDIGASLEAAGTFAVYVRGGGAWDMKRILRYSLGNRERGEVRGYTRITWNRQIYPNVWGNLLYGYIGLRDNFALWELKIGGTVAADVAQTNTPGNLIERQMGYDMFYRVRRHYSEMAIEIAIMGRFNSLSHYCDVLPFPSNGSCGGRHW